MAEILTYGRREDLNAFVLTIRLDDHDIARKHLVPLDAASPVDVLANYALHCLRVLLEPTVEEKARRLWEDRKRALGQEG